MSIENTVRTVFAHELAVPACNIRPETALSEDLIGPKALNRISFRLRSTFNIDPVIYIDWSAWTTVGCAIDAVERLLEREKERAA